MRRMRHLPFCSVQRQVMGHTTSLLHSRINQTFKQTHKYKKHAFFLSYVTNFRIVWWVKESHDISGHWTDELVFCNHMSDTEITVCSWCNGSSDWSFMVDPLNHYLFQSVLHNWCNKGQDMCYPSFGMVQIKKCLLLIGRSNPCSGGSRFPFRMVLYNMSDAIYP